MGKAQKLKCKDNGRASSTSNPEGRQRPRIVSSSHDMPVLLRERVRRRLMKSNQTWSIFYGELEKIRVLLLKLVDFIDGCSNIATVERVGNDRLISALQDRNANPAACKTNVVAPMVGGLPLKKLVVTLERLPPSSIENLLGRSSSATSSASPGSSKKSVKRKPRQRNVGTSDSVSGFTRSHSKSSGGGSSSHS